MGKSGRMLCWLMCAAVLAVAATARADAVAEKRAAQNKLLAMRAARVDAMRKLAERINGLMITSETTVKDFVATDDRIRTEMMSWLSGMKEVGEPRFTPDGICEVTLEVTIQEVVTELKRLHKKYYKGDKVRTRDIEKILTRVEEKTLRETGSGAPRPEFEPRGQLAPPDAGGQDIMPQEAWAYWGAHCTGRGRLMAQRAARLDALRKLGERIKGLLITSTTTVKDFVATSDDIETRMRTFLRGAREVGTRYHISELIVEVEMEITLQDLVVNLQRWHKEYYRGDRFRSADFQKITTRMEEKTLRETGMGVPPEKYLKDLGPRDQVAVNVGRQAVDWPPAMRVTGQAAVDDAAGNAAQAKLMAYRAAELDARRKLAEQLDGLMITSNTSVKDFVALDDQIRTSMMTFQQGARRVNGSERLLPDGTAEVMVEIDTQPLVNMILYYEQKMSLKVR